MWFRSAFFCKLVHAPAAPTTIVKKTQRCIRFFDCPLWQWTHSKCLCVIPDRIPFREEYFYNAPNFHVVLLKLLKAAQSGTEIQGRA